MTYAQYRLGDAPPVTPGELLVGEFLEPLNITQSKFAEAIGVSAAYVSDIVNGRRGISADMALRFEAALAMPAQFWLNAQAATDLYHARVDSNASAKRSMIQHFITASA